MRPCPVALVEPLALGLGEVFVDPMRERRLRLRSACCWTRFCEVVEEPSEASSAALAMFATVPNPTNALTLRRPTKRDLKAQLRSTVLSNCMVRSFDWCIVSVLRSTWLATVLLIRAIRKRPSTDGTGVRTNLQLLNLVAARPTMGTTSSRSRSLGFASCPLGQFAFVTASLYRLREFSGMFPLFPPLDDLTDRPTNCLTA